MSLRIDNVEEIESQICYVKPAALECQKPALGSLVFGELDHAGAQPPIYVIE